MVFETLTVREEGPVVFVEIAAPPMNLLTPGLVRDLVSLIQETEADEAVRVLVFTSADPDCFISHVDVTRISGFVLATDMQFAARESAIFSQFEPAFGVLPGGGATQHLVRLMGRSRTLEVMLSAADYDADLAERYGWINRALPAEELGDFVSSLAQRVAAFPAAGHAVVKQRVNAVALAPAEDFRRDSDLFAEAVRKPEAQGLLAAALRSGLQTRDAEMDLASMLGELARGDAVKR